MGKTTSKKSSVKASAAKPSGNSLPRDKTTDLDPAIRFYTLEDGADTTEGLKTEIFVVHDSILTVSNKKLINRNFAYIDTFDREGPAVVNTMHELTRRVFEHLDITSHMDVDQRVSYK